MCELCGAPTILDESSIDELLKIPIGTDILYVLKKKIRDKNKAPGDLVLKNSTPDTNHPKPIIKLPDLLATNLTQPTTLTDSQGMKIWFLRDQQITGLKGIFEDYL